MYWIQVFLTTGIFALAALGLYVTFTAGQFSLGHGALFGAGAYMAGVADVKLGLPLVVGLGLAVAAAAVLGALFSVLLSSRLSHLYLAIGTLAFGGALVVIVNNIDYLGGIFGISGIRLETNIWMVWVAIVVGVLGLLALDLSGLGRRMRLVGGDPLLARSLGLAPWRYMLFAWVLGGAITGLAGGLFAHNLGTVQTSDFGFTLSVQLLVAVLLGGASTPIGPVIATMFVVVLPELLRDVIGDEGRIYLYGVALLLVVIFRRDGIFTRKSARAIHAAVKAPFAPLRPGREQ